MVVNLTLFELNIIYDGNKRRVLFDSIPSYVQFFLSNLAKIAPFDPQVPELL
jgi:hypothetical protein